MECPRCKGELSLELPDKNYEADYSIDCPNCNEQFLINVEKLHKQEPVIEWEKRKKIVRKDPTLLIKPRFKNRLRVATAFLVLAFVLGLTTGILTSLYGFIIPNPDIFFETETAKVEGSVLNFEGDPLEGVIVTVIDSSFSDVSNTLGIYLIEEVPVGDYTIKAEMAGYQSVKMKITVTAGKPNIHDIVLKRGDPSFVEELDNSFPVTKKEDTLVAVTTIAAILISSFFALLGAYLVFTRQRFLFAVGCAVLGIMSIGFGIGSVLCVITLVLLISCKQGFNS